MNISIDMTDSLRPPVFDVKLACPNCEAPYMVREVTAGEEVTDDEECESCGHRVETALTIEVEFNIKSTNPKKAKKGKRK